MSSRKISILKDTAWYALANYISQGIGVFNSFLLRGFMGPAAIGMWSVIQVVLGYCGYASLGTTRALGRDYPILRGRGDFVQAEHTMNSTLTFSIFVSFVPAIGLLGWAVWKRELLETPFLIGILFLCIFLFVQRFYDFLVTLLRSEKEFKVLSAQIVLSAVGGIAITVFLVQPWKIYGLYAGTALITVLLTVYLCWVHPYHFKIELHKATLVHELKLGLPLIVCAFLYSFLIGLDKLVLAKKLGFYEVGLYSVAGMASNYILSLPMMFSNVLYPNLLERYGEKKEDMTQIISYLEKPVFVLSILTPFLCAIAFAVMPLLVGLFLKKFILGLSCMKIYLAGAFFLLMGQFANNFLVAIDKYLQIIPVLLVAIAINFFANRAWIAVGWSVNGVAFGTVLSFAFYGLLAYLLALREVFGMRRAIKKIVKNTLVFFTFMIGIVLVDFLAPSSSSLLLTALIKGFLFLVVSLPFLVYMENREHLFGTLWALLIDKLSFGKS